EADADQGVPLVPPRERAPGSRVGRSLGPRGLREVVRSLAVLSMHTSPLAQPGTGDGGGMNVYVRELAAALARAGVQCDVYTRAESPTAPPVVRVEPGLRVNHVPAGPLAHLPKEALPGVVEEFTE